MHTTFVPPQKRAGDAPPGLALVVVCTAGEPSIAPEVVPLTAGLRVGREVEGTNALSLASDRMLSRVQLCFTSPTARFGSRTAAPTARS